MAIGQAINSTAGAAPKNDLVQHFPNDDNIDLNSVFADPENDKLTYVAKVIKGEPVEVEIVDNVLQVTPVSEGTSEIIIYASDEQGGIVIYNFQC